VPDNGGYIAMSLWRLGRKDEALAAIKSLRAVIAEEHAGCDCVRHLDAALEVISSKTGRASGDDQNETEENE